MISINTKAQCCGCTACVNICHRGCISMIPDEEGFLFPIVDTKKCINCKLCEKVCPMRHQDFSHEIKRTLCAKHIDNSVRQECSSGGVFALLSEAFVSLGGIVVGCTMDSKLRAMHTFAKTKEDLITFRSSKYVQSDIRGVFQQIKTLLDSGNHVLFSGTPCQVSGLRNFLQKPYINLICIDVLCHGVPSPKLLNDYISAQEEKTGSRASFISFRCKRHEWKRLHIEIKYKNGMDYYKNATYDPYMQLFLSNKSQRSSCFHCPFTTTHRMGDISLGDFWGIGKVYHSFDDNMGLSMVLINSKRGELLFEKIVAKLSVFETQESLAIKGNKVLVENISGEEQRNLFYRDYVEKGYNTAIAQHTYHYNLLHQMYINTMRKGLDLLRKIQKKGY